MTRITRRSAAPAGALALLLAAAVLPACGGAADDTSPADGDAAGRPVTTRPAVTVAFAAALPTGSFTPVTEADRASTAALYVVADWTGLSGSQAERLELVKPSGILYYAQSIPLVDTSTSLVRVWTLPGGTVRAVYKLNIWGTPIDLYAMVGTWTATAKLVKGTATGSATVVLR